MRLILQCAVCGTNHAVGAEVCITCRAAGVANLRLLFECTTCFAVGIRPNCIVCDPPPVLPPPEVPPEPVDPEELARRWGVAEDDELEMTPLLDLPELECTPAARLGSPAPETGPGLAEDLPEASEDPRRLDPTPEPPTSGG